MKYYAVIDTNVIVSSLLCPGSIPDQVVDMTLNGPIIPLINKEIIIEYQEVLLRNKFGFTPEKISAFLELFIKRGILIDRTETNEIFVDIDDIVFYEVVLTARVNQDAYLVTGNNKHFPKKSFVVTPKEMLEIINRKDER